MRFRGQTVWVRVDGQGKVVLDRDGRAEMRYRADDSRSYRPSPANLEPGEPGEPAAGDPPADVPLSVPVSAPARARPSRAGRGPGESKPDTIHVWTDGACTGNPGPMGIGVVVIASGERRELGEFLGLGTNNIAELTAIERGLQVAEQLAPERSRPVQVYSDSAYSIGVISQGWKAKANQELVARLRRQVAGFSDLSFVKVAGHAGIPENERCDQLARRAIELRAAT
jgi:ribonuclease HI